MGRFLPRKPHDVMHVKAFLRVGLGHAQAFHPHTLPAFPTLKLTKILPLHKHRLEFRRGAPAKVIPAHADTPQHQSHRSIDVFTAYAVEGIFFRMITKLPATGLLFPIAGSYGIKASDALPSPTIRPILWIWKKAYQKKMRKGRRTS